jgi:hypothetical protein
MLQGNSATGSYLHCVISPVLDIKHRPRRGSRPALMGALPRSALVQGEANSLSFRSRQASSESQR